MVDVMLPISPSRVESGKGWLVAHQGKYQELQTNFCVLQPIGKMHEVAKKGKYIVVPTHQELQTYWAESILSWRVHL